MSFRTSSTRQTSGKLRGPAASPANSGSDGINSGGSGAAAPSPTATSFPSPAALQSPCFVHSYLDSGLGAFRNHQDASYFDAGHQQQSLPAAAMWTQRDGGQQSFDHKHSHANGSADHGQASLSLSADKAAAAAMSPAASASSARQRRTSARPQPMHRGMRGAVEPDSDNEDGSGSGASESGSTSQGESDSYVSSDDEEVRVRSLTRQLAETAVGVREMSKQLGRARVKSRIQSVLIITKARDNHLIKLTRELAIWLMTTPRNDREYGLTVYVDSQLRQSKRFDAEGIRRDHPEIFCVPSMSASTLRRTGDVSTSSGSNESSTADVADIASKTGQSSATESRKGSISNGRTSGEESLLRYWTSDMCSRSPHLFDFVVTLGGDGTVLFCSWLFQRIVPPVMPFALGSLGFLTNFDFTNYQKYLKSALDTGIRVNLRMRFTATVYRVTHPINETLDKRRRRAIKSGKTGEIIMKTLRESGWESIEKPLPHNHDLRGAHTEGLQGDDSEDQDCLANDPPKKDKEIMCFSTRPVETFEVLNDLVVDRGPSPYVSLLEVFGDEHHLTTAQADGLCISTPTGSTAYSLSAGGSLVHPEIPAILISPICPHTLSFRPMLLPDSMELRIAVPYNSRSTAWASFDGRGRVELKQGDHIKVTASKYPFPTVCADNQSSDWFESISRTLKWNERQRQKSFVVVEEGDEGDPQEQESRKAVSSSSKAAKKADGEGTGTQTISNGDAKASGDKLQEAEDEDEADDDAEEDEKFDIDDSSTVVTRANSPDSSLRRRHSTMSDGRHHHHHHHHDRHRTRSSNDGASTKSSSSASLSMSSLKPMTSLKSTPLHDADSSDGRQTQSSAGAKVNFDESPSQSRSQGSGRNQNGVVDPSSRSLLDSPDRFGLAGPPDPPRALSERHLASADFRLDESPDSDGVKKPDVAKGGEKSAFRSSSTLKESTSARSTSSASTRTPEMNAAQLRESIVEVAESNAKIASGSNRLYRKLKGRSSSRARESGSRQRSSGEGGGEGLHGGFELGRTDSRKASGGAALVVYGQDESDSDSTAEG